MGEVGQLRAQRVLSRLRAVTSALSGCPPSELDEASTFLELGFDSLFLTQLAGAFQREYGLKVTFRQLYDDLPTLRAMADHIDQALPPEVATPHPAEATAPLPTPHPAVQPSPPTSPPAPGAAGVPQARAPQPSPLPLPTLSAGAGSAELPRIMAEQLALMSQQLQLLQAARAASAGVAAGTAYTHPATAAPSAPLPTPASPVESVPAASAGTATATTGERAAEPAPAALPKGFGPKGGREVQPLTQHQRDHIDRLVARYNARTMGSKLSTQAHRRHHADPRTAAGFNRQWKELVYPIVIERSRGCILQDIDGNEYIDILNGFGPNFLGHSPPFVSEALKAQIDRGIEVGPQTPLAGEAARLFCELTGMDRVSWVNTGSEAVQAAIRLSRTYTGRSRIVVFSGDYHGNFDEVLVRVTKTGSGRRTLPLAPGIPFRAVEDVLVLDYGTDESLDIIRENASEIAAVLVEPVQSRRPEFQPREFLHALRKLTEQEGIVLVFDEVITGFRIRPGGAQEYYGIEADVATYGKIIGGGMPIGVVAGRARFMDTFDGGYWQYGDDSFPSAGVTFFAGTFVRHPMAIAAAHATLQYLKAQGPELQEAVNRRTTRLAGELNGFLEAQGLKIRIPHFASQMFIRVQEDSELATLLFYHLRDRGIHVLEGFPSYMTAAHSDEHVDRIIAAFKDSILEMQHDGVLPQSGTPESMAWRRTLPLTRGQREIWFASQMGDTASCAFNESDTVMIHGPLDAARFTAAVAASMAEQEAFRYRFDADGHSQWVDPEATFDVPLVDLSTLDEGARAEALDAFFDTQALTPFDLQHGPLVRAALVKLGAEEYLFVIYCHHIVFDGYSSEVLMRRIAQVYSADAGADATTLSGIAPYSVYLHRAEYAARTAGATALDYWRAVFASGVPAPLDLPTDRARGATRNHRGATVHREIDVELSQRLRALAKTLNSSLYTLLLAAFQTLLSRLSAQEDIVVGIPVAGQASLQVETVGCCANVLPLRAATAPDKPFAALVAEQQRALLDAFDHQAASLGDIVNSLGMPRDRSRLPLVEVIFNFSSYFAHLALPGCEVSTHENRRRAVYYDQFFNVIETDGRLVIDWDYCSDLFDESTMSRWADHYVELLRGAIDDRCQVLGQLPLLSAQQRDEIAAMWAGP